MAGLREKQKTARNKRILDAATLLFKRDGYDKTRMEDIAKVAEVSTGAHSAALVSSGCYGCMRRQHGARLGQHGMGALI